jgi:hypothetical protein
MTMSWIILAVVAWPLAGCNSDRPGESTSTERSKVQAVDSDDATHVLARKFAFVLNGPVTDTPSDASIRHQTQTEAFVEFPGTGALVGWSLPSAPQMQVGWPGSIDQHDALAKAYFLGLDVNVSEIGAVTHFSGHSKAATTSNPDAEQVTELGYSTSFRRTASGFDVVDSRAAVPLNANGQVVGLHFLWPDVPSAALSDARALQAVLAKGWTPVADAVGVGWQTVNNHVVIHHGLGDDTALQWLSTIRVDLINGSKTSYVDCDAEGARVYPYGGTVAPSQQRP